MKHLRIIVALSLLAPGIVLIESLSIRRVHGSTFTVTTATDNGNNASPTAGSLRKAIIDANANAGLDIIQFNIGGGGVKTISPLTNGLPAITSPVVIDGYTQPGSSVNTATTSNNAILNIVLDGSSIVGTTNGLFFSGGGSSSTIKGLVIVNFPGNGIRLDTDSNKVQGCFIGIDSLGVSALPNDNSGVLLSGGTVTGGSNNLIGTNGDGSADLAEKNILSGNTLSGVRILNTGATGNTVKGNFIGTERNGISDLGNTTDGVDIDQASNNTIGGFTANERNIISGNNSDGIEIHGSGASGNVIQGNFIGTSSLGTADLGNVANGVFINAVAGNTVSGNVISGNNSDGVELNASAATGNTVAGNIIGLNSAGTTNLGNTGNGVLINSADSNTIGGTSTSERNVISGNGLDGVRLVANAGSNLIQGNIIGLDIAGTANRGNLADGIHVDDSNNVLVGSTTAGGGNIISANKSDGIEIEGTSTATLIQGNFIGTDISGTGNVGNTANGVRVGTSGNTIGGTGSAGNVISANVGSGISMANSSGNLVQNNFIGTDVSGTSDLGNGLIGVVLQNVNNSTIRGNIIAFSGLDGLSLVSGTGNGILTNSIFSNGSAGSDLGIDLGDTGPAPNDNLDPDTGPNNLQNYPVLTSAVRNTGNNTTTITGSLDSTPSTDFVLQFFSNPSCDISGNGEGKTYLGSTTVKTTFDGNPVSFVIAFATGVPVGQSITATATDSGLNTSEFSACRTVIGDSPTAIEFASASATGFDDGVFIQWQTGMEVNNLGFNLYRENGGTFEAVNGQLIAGSALMFASEVELRSGHAYELWDARPAGKATAYWIEDHDLNGQSSWHGPFYPTPGSEKERPASIQQAKTLAVLGVNDSPSAALESLAKLPGSSASSGALKLTATLPTPESGASIRLAIKHEGWYRLSQAEVLAAGLSKSTDPRLFQLFVDGKQQPITVNGQDDGSFDPSDSIEFYGTGIDSAFSDARTYYLSVGRKPGLRVTQLKSPAFPQRGGSFACTVERRERSIYFAALLNGERENFFGSVIASQPVNQSLTLSNVDLSSNSQAQLKVVLQGVTNIDHVVTIEVNGSFAGLLRFQAQASGETTLSIPHSLLQEGANVVRLIPQGGPSDVSLVDSVQLTYQHTFSADENALRFKASGGQPVTVEGFTDPAIRVFDVTDQFSVKEVHGAIEEQEDKQLGSTASVTFTAPGNGVRTLLALSDSRAKRADKVAVDSPSNLRGTVQDAAFVIVTSRDFSNQADSLKSYRQSQGLSAAVVDIEDIYDEFSFGQKNPQAVKNFLSFANRTWGTRYGLLLGDSSFDPKNYLGLGDTDIVQTRLLDTFFMETASDDWLADFDQNGIADFAIGRLPARTAAEARTMIEKIFIYEKSHPSNEALLVSDRNEGFNFEQTNTQLIPLLPAGTTATHLRRSVLGDGGTRAAAIDAINRGPRIVSYAGHGSTNVWRGNTFAAPDAAGLRNSERPTMFVILNCLNGYFQDPATESLAEALMRNPNGGAAAAWASSAMTFADGQVSLGQEFYRQVFGARARIGDAALRAKSSTTDADIRKTWILFGDPTMKLK